MPGKKTKSATKKFDPADAVSELLALAEKLHLADGCFDAEVEDECNDEAMTKASGINSGPLMGQLEFLLDSGYTPERLAELIQEHAP